jgi:hypothetical protein
VASDEESDNNTTLYTSQMDDGGGNLTARKADFKLRLPYTLNHSK